MFWITNFLWDSKRSYDIVELCTKKASQTEKSNFLNVDQLIVIILNIYCLLHFMFLLNIVGLSLNTKFTILRSNLVLITGSDGENT